MQQTVPHLRDDEGRLSDHIRIEERSIALHRAVAKQIRANPRLMEKAKGNLQRYLKHFMQKGGTPTSALLEWLDIVENKSLEEILELLVSGAEKARRLRQSSPFAGILTPQERWKIYEAYRPGAYYQSRGKYRRG